MGARHESSRYWRWRFCDLPTRKCSGLHDRSAYPRLSRIEANMVEQKTGKAVPRLENAVMAELTDHEKYMAGIPLTDELAALRRGEMPEQWQPEAPPMVKEVLGVRVTLRSSQELTRTELIALKELRQS